MNSINGTLIKYIFKSLDSSFLVALFKVKENDFDSKYNNKIITITGYLLNIEINTDLKLFGEFVTHVKYGYQFNVNNYEILIPTKKNAIVSFLSSDLFKGIGESKALKIYNKLKENTISLIKDNPECLKDISGLTNKNIEIIYNKLMELENSSSILIKLNEIGFSIKDSTLIYKTFKDKTLDIIDNDIYNLFYEIKQLGFNKVDKIFKEINQSLDDIKRVKAGIIYTMQINSYETGNTCINYQDIESNLKIIINYEISNDLFNQAILDLVDEFKIIKVDDQYYELIEYHEADLNIVKRITYLNNKKDLDIKESKINKEIDNISKLFNINYDDIQKDAIKNSFLKNFLIITGGPGTGKTSILKSIVELYRNLYDVDSKTLLEEVYLLAPTGRASKRIMEATNYNASTIHRFLKWNKDTDKFQINEHNKSNAKLVIIDECSMIDTLLFSNLLNGLRYDTRIILIGDDNQLPSVSPGHVLHDLIESNIFKCIKLKTLYRQEEGSNIITLAYDIKENNINYQIFNKSEDLIFYQANSEDLSNKLIYLSKEFLKNDYHDFQIMAPMYKTLNGIINLNYKLQNLFNPKSSNKNEIIIHDILYRESDKILQLTNMPDDNIYNGDIGIIIRIDNFLSEITVDFDSNIVTFNKNNFDNFTLGYVISIHKSQGSEFESVIIPILKEYNRMLYQKLLYTAVTRAKKKLILIGELEAYQKCVLNNYSDTRKTNLKESLKKRYQDV